MVCGLVSHDQQTTAALRPQKVHSPDGVSQQKEPSMPFVRTTGAALGKRNEVLGSTLTLIDIELSAELNQRSNTSRGATDNECEKVVHRHWGNTPHFAGPRWV